MRLEDGRHGYSHGKEEDPFWLLERVATHLHWVEEHLAEVKVGLGVAPLARQGDLYHGLVPKLGTDTADDFEAMDDAVRQLRDCLTRLDVVVRREAEDRLSPEASKRLAELIVNPPSPTRALVRALRHPDRPVDDEEMLEVYRRHFESLAARGSSGGKVVEVVVKERRDLAGGRVALVAFRSANAVDLLGLRGRKVSAGGADWYVLDVETFGGLGDGVSDEVGLIVRPA